MAGGDGRAGGAWDASRPGFKSGGYNNRTHGRNASAASAAFQSREDFEMRPNRGRSAFVVAPISAPPELRDTSCISLISRLYLRRSPLCKRRRD